MHTIQQLLEGSAATRNLPIYVFTGEEYFLKQRAIAQLRTGDAGKSAVEEQQFDANTASASEVLQAACTVSMFSPEQRIIVHNFDAFAAAEQNKFIDYLEKPPSGTTLILSAEKLDGRSKLSKLARSQSYLFEAAPLRTADLRGFVQSEAKRRSHPIRPEAVDQIVDAIGNDLFGICDALERLSLYVGQGAAIEGNHVSQCVEPTRTETIWALVDGVAKKETKPAIQALRSLLADREPALRILAMIARQLRIVTRARAVLVQGGSPSDAAKAAGAPPFKADELARSARLYHDASLANAFLQIAECDQQLKGATNKPESVIERCVLQLCAK